MAGSLRVFGARNALYALDNNMCGIAGMVGRMDAREQVTRMIAALAHRGADGAGIFTTRPEAANPETALGHARLAILDLSPAGVQPMTSRDGRWTIVFNGELFNYRELRGELGTTLGPGPWRSSSDTEVLLEACAVWGVERSLDRSVGMFAFALWDAQERELTLARDRMGEKPLVYFEDGRTLAFASELKALRDLHGGYLDGTALEVYLALGYVPAPLAIFRNVRKLPAGHWLRWKDGRSRVERWWFPERARPAISCTLGARMEEARSLIADAVHLRLRSDVPVALALSGGIDSTVIAAAAARQDVRPDAFTVIAEGDETDLPYAQSVAERYGLRHEVLRAPATSAAERVRDAAGHFDEPFADSSALSALELARSLAGRYKVILNGDGGDEAFGGYWHYTRIALKQAVKAAAAGVGLADGNGATGVYVESKVAFREGERATLLGGSVESKVAFREGERATLLGGSTGALSRLLTADQFLSASPRAGALHNALWTDRHLYLANDLTHKMDIALGAYGIEGRSPFLDHRVLEWTQQLPAHDLVRGGNKKILLRAAYSEELSKEISERPKHGFGAPVEAWLAGPLREMVRELLPCPLLDPELQTHARGQRLWTLLTLAQWAVRWGAKH
jgi:asparagine synthase (glutamine-hydrolysing)